MSNKGARLAGRVRLNSLSIGATIIIVAMGAILFFQTLALNKLEAELNGQQLLISQTKVLATSLDTNAKQRTQQINQLNRHLDCIVLFFSQPDRTQKAITNIDSCTLQNFSTGTTSTPKTTSSAPIKSTTPKTVATTGSSGSTGSTPKGSIGSSGSTGATSSTGSAGSSGSTGSTTPLGGSSNPSFLQKTVITPLNSNIIQPITDIINKIL